MHDFYYFTAKLRNKEFACVAKNKITAKKSKFK